MIALRTVLFGHGGKLSLFNRADCNR